MKWIVVVLAILTFSSPLQAGGSKIAVELMNDAIVKGELLSVREDALVIAMKDYTEYTVKPEDQSRIAVLKFEDVRVVETPASSYTLVGTGAGFLGGLAITGVLLSSQEQTNPIDLVVGSMVILGGTILGFAVGELSSSPSTRTIVEPRFDFAKLKSHSRYPEGEPGVLQAVQYYSSLK